MDRLMFSDKELEVVDYWRYHMIGVMAQDFNTPSRREFKPNSGIKTPVNFYSEGARFNIGHDVFKIISVRTRGKKHTMVVRFEGVF